MRDNICAIVIDVEAVHQIFGAPAESGKGARASAFLDEEGVDLVAICCKVIEPLLGTLLIVVLEFEMSVTICQVFAKRLELRFRTC